MPKSLNQIINYNYILSESNVIKIDYIEKNSTNITTRSSSNKDYIKDILSLLNSYNYRLTPSSNLKAINKKELLYENFNIIILDSNSNEIFRAYTKGVNHILILDKKNNFNVYTLNKNINSKLIKKIFIEIK